MPTKIMPKADFLTSIGNGAMSGGKGQTDGSGGSGDPTITYVVKPTFAKPMGRAGAFGTPSQTGKQPTTIPMDGDDY